MSDLASLTNSKTNVHWENDDEVNSILQELDSFQPVTPVNKRITTTTTGILKERNASDRPLSSPSSRANISNGKQVTIMSNKPEKRLSFAEDISEVNKENNYPSPASDRSVSSVSSLSEPNLMIDVLALKRELKDTKKAHKKLAREYQKQKKLKSQFEDENESIRTDLEKQKLDNQALVFSNEELRSTVTYFTKIKQELEDKINVCLTDIQDKDEALQKIQTKVDTLQNELDQQNQRYQSQIEAISNNHRQVIHEKENYISNLEQEVCILKQSVEETVAKQQEDFAKLMDQTYESHRLSCDELMIKVKDDLMSSVVAPLNAMLEIKDNRLNEVEAQLAQIVSEKNELLHQLSVSQNLVEDQRRENEATNLNWLNARGDYERSLSELQAQLEQQKSQLIESEERKLEITNDLNTVRKDMDMQVQALKTELATKAAEYELERNVLLQKNEELALLHKEQVCAFEKEISEASNRLHKTETELRRYLDARETQLLEQSRLREEIMSQFMKNETEYMSLARQKEEEHTRTICNLQSELQKVITQNNDLTHKLEQQSLEIADLNGCITQRDEKLQITQAELDKIVRVHEQQVHLLQKEMEQATQTFMKKESELIETMKQKEAQALNEQAVELSTLYAHKEQNLQQHINTCEDQILKLLTIESDLRAEVIRQKEFYQVQIEKLTGDNELHLTELTSQLECQSQKMLDGIQREKMLTQQFDETLNTHQQLLDLVKISAALCEQELLDKLHTTEERLEETLQQYASSSKNAQQRESEQLERITALERDLADRINEIQQQSETSQRREQELNDSIEELRQSQSSLTNLLSTTTEHFEQDIAILKLEATQKQEELESALKQQETEFQSLIRLEEEEMAQAIANFTSSTQNIIRSAKQREGELLSELQKSFEIKESGLYSQIEELKRQLVEQTENFEQREKNHKKQAANDLCELREELHAQELLHNRKELELVSKQEGLEAQLGEVVQSKNQLELDLKTVQESFSQIEQIMKNISKIHSDKKVWSETIEMVNEQIQEVCSKTEAGHLHYLVKEYSQRCITINDLYGEHVRRIEAKQQRFLQYFHHQMARQKSSRSVAAAPAPSKSSFPFRLRKKQ